MKKTSLYEYADGSANVYKLTPSTLEYIPVKKEESSTGMYSGGEPKTVSITEAQYERIGSLLEAAMNNTSVHIKDRQKMSGAIWIIDGDNTKKCIIKPRSAEIATIEEALKDALR